MEDAGHAGLQGENIFNQFVVKITETPRSLFAMHQAIPITLLQWIPPWSEKKLFDGSCHSRISELPLQKTIFHLYGAM